MYRTFLILLFSIAFLQLQAQWRTVNLNGMTYTRKISFVTDSIGFTVDNHFLYKTTDEGDNWSITGQFPPGRVNSGYYVDASFIDDSNIFIISGHFDLYKSQNGGNSWTSVMSTSMPDHMIDVEFVSPLKGFVFSYDLGGSYLYLSRTIDGGLNWTRDTIFFANLARGMQFTSPDTGYAIAEKGSYGYLLKTYDGGVTWTNNWFVNIGPLHDLHFINNDTGYIVGEDINGVEILKTTDAGNNWTSIIPGNSVPQVQFNNLNSVHFTSADTGYVGGYQGRFLYTTDGGQTWTPQHKNFWIKEIFFTNPNVGFIAGDSSNFLKTTTAGIGNITTLQEKKQAIDNAFTLYPNPTSSYFHINTQQTGKLEIRGMDGKLIYETRLVSKKTTISVENLRSGTYLARFTNSFGESEVQKFVVID